VDCSAIEDEDEGEGEDEGEDEEEKEEEEETPWGTPILFYRGYRLSFPEAWR
jgi:hypothetical protein